MPYQEIKDLLDKQEYLEALQIAREEYKANAGLWEARNLFRCLYHNTKAAAKDNDPELASEFLEQMQLLYQSHDLNDEINNGMLEPPDGSAIQPGYLYSRHTHKQRPEMAKAHTPPFHQYTMTAGYPTTKPTLTDG